MNQPKHTPGPWHVLDHPNREYFVYGPDGNLVANCDGWINHTLADKQANARLIAAAPELLEACIEALRQLSAPDCPVIPDGAMVRGRLYAALKKATIDN